MKLKHWMGLAFLAIGVLFVWHVMVSHGGVGGFRAGLGLG